MNFSERYGFKLTKDIQIESMDKELRTSLWNLIYNYFLEFIRTPNSIRNRGGNEFYYFFRNEVWGQHLKQPVDELRPMYIRNQLRSIYFGLD